MEKKTPQRVLVFAEYGADSRTMCKALRETFARAAAPVEVIPVTAAQMRAPGMMDPQKTLAFILPGASDANYDTKMGADNIAALRGFVKDGGRFLGVCAGAYYACESIEWYGWEPERTKRKRPGIDFFAYHAEGPIREFLAPQDKKTELDRSLSHAAPVKVTFDNGHHRQTATVLYWGGPRLNGAGKGQVLAHFNGAAGNAPAVVMRKYGHGTAIISSVHPEIRGQDFVDAVFGDGPLQQRARNAGRAVANDEHGRNALWHTIMRRMFPEFVR